MLRAGAMNPHADMNADEYREWLRYNAAGGEDAPMEWLEKRRGTKAVGSQQEGVCKGQIPVTGAQMAGTVPAPRRSSIPSKRTTRGEIKFDSKMEARFYDHIAMDPDALWVDVHPVVTLSTGRRWQADFLVWYTHEMGPRLEAPQLFEVKGRTEGDAWRRFQLVREDFDTHHPLAPLAVVTWDYKEKRWRSI